MPVEILKKKEKRSKGTVGKQFLELREKKCLAFIREKKKKGGAGPSPNPAGNKKRAFSNFLGEDSFPQKGKKRKIELL